MRGNGLKDLGEYRRMGDGWFNAWIDIYIWVDEGKADELMDELVSG